MEHIVVTKVYQLGETMQVLHAMQRINVPTTIWCHVHSVQVQSRQLLHANVPQQSIG